MAEREGGGYDVGEDGLLFDGGEYFDLAAAAGQGFYRRCLSERMGLRLADIRSHHPTAVVVERRIWEEGGRLHSLMRVAPPPPPLPPAKGKARAA